MNCMWSCFGFTNNVQWNTCRMNTCEWLNVTVYTVALLTSASMYMYIVAEATSILKIDSTKKLCKKFQGAVANTASWATNVGNERGEVWSLWWQSRRVPKSSRGLQTDWSRGTQTGTAAPRQVHPSTRYFYFHYSSVCARVCISLIGRGKTPLKKECSRANTQGM